MSNTLDHDLPLLVEFPVRDAHHSEPLLLEEHIPLLIAYLLRLMSFAVDLQQQDGLSRP